MQVCRVYVQIGALIRAYSHFNCMSHAAYKAWSEVHVATHG